MAKSKDKIEIIETLNIELNFYAIRSKDGKWLRSIGYGGGRKSWVDDIADAKIYGKIGPARSRITFWANHYPEFGVPDIVLISSGKCHILDEGDRVAKAILKSKKEKIEGELRGLKRQVEYYQSKIKEISQKSLDSLNQQITQKENQLKKL